MRESNEIKTELKAMNNFPLIPKDEEMSNENSPPKKEPNQTEIKTNLSENSTNQILNQSQHTNKINIPGEDPNQILINIENYHNEYKEKYNKFNNSLKTVLDYKHEMVSIIGNIEKEKEKRNKEYFRECCCCCGFCCCDKCCGKKCYHYKTEYANNNQIKTKIEELIENEEKILNIKELRKEYIKKEKLSYESIPKKSLVLYFFSLFHFFAMAEIHGILFSLLKQIFSLIIKDQFYENSTFYIYLTESTLHDSSQINFNYLSSILSDFLFCRFGIKNVYPISIVCILFFISLLKFFEFSDYLDSKDIGYGINWISIIIFIYLSFCWNYKFNATSYYAK